MSLRNMSADQRTFVRNLKFIKSTMRILLDVSNVEPTYPSTKLANDTVTRFFIPGDPGGGSEPREDVLFLARGRSAVCGWRAWRSGV